LDLLVPVSGSAITHDHSVLNSQIAIETTLATSVKNAP
jgi:hypothetical protein